MHTFHVNNVPNLDNGLDLQRHYREGISGKYIQHKERAWKKYQKQKERLRPRQGT